jgi:thiol-disulfide isomerase/thioredoxin
MKNRFLFLLLLALSVCSGGAPAAAEDKIQSLEPGSFGRIVAAGKGKPMVVMLWSLTCDYCEPSFDALANAKRSKGLEVVTVATDRADDHEAAQLIRKKLSRHGLAANGWAFGTAPAERLRYDIDPKWRGEMPRTYWFKSDGRMRAYSGMITPEIAAEMLGK